MRAITRPAAGALTAPAVEKPPVLALPCGSSSIK
jgi:hypothetical protein